MQGREAGTRRHVRTGAVQIAEMAGHGGPSPHFLLLRVVAPCDAAHEHAHHRRDVQLSRCTLTSNRSDPSMLRICTRQSSLRHANLLHLNPLKVEKSECNVQGGGVGRKQQFSGSEASLAAAARSSAEHAVDKGAGAAGLCEVCVRVAGLTETAIAPAMRKEAEA
jgi:hypothetical protein